MRTRQQPTRFNLISVCCLMLLTVSSGLEAANTIAVGVGVASPGESDVHVIVTATNDVSIHGYSIAFMYPTDVLELTRISTNGTSVQELKPDFVGSAFDNQLGVGSMGVILTLSEATAAKELPPIREDGGARIIARPYLDGMKWAFTTSHADGTFSMRVAPMILFLQVLKSGHGLRVVPVDAPLEVMLPAPGRLEIDFGAVEYVPSGVIGVLIAVHNRIEQQKGRLALTNVHPQVREMFKMTGLDAMFVIED